MKANTSFRVEEGVIQIKEEILTKRITINRTMTKGITTGTKKRTITGVRRKTMIITRRKTLPLKTLISKSAQNMKKKWMLL